VTYAMNIKLCRVSRRRPPCDKRRDVCRADLAPSCRRSVTYDAPPPTVPAGKGDVPVEAVWYSEDDACGGQQVSTCKTISWSLIRAGEYCRKILIRYHIIAIDIRHRKHH